jgi:septal ring factor EnvC (AmiA/AmiB activator)
MPKNLLSHATALLLCAVFSDDARSLSAAAKEFIEISRSLEEVQCEKRRLRREIALAEAERRDASALRSRFAALDRDPKTAKLEKRLGALEPRVKRSTDPGDLEAISRQHREAFYRCE